MVQDFSQDFLLSGKSLGHTNLLIWAWDLCQVRKWALKEITRNCSLRDSQMTQMGADYADLIIITRMPKVSRAACQWSRQRRGLVNKSSESKAAITRILRMVAVRHAEYADKSHTESTESTEILFLYTTNRTNYTNILTQKSRKSKKVLGFSQ